MLIDAADETRLVLCTCPDEESAARLGASLVDRRLAACVNVLPRIRSIYRWQNQVNDEAEALMLIKTTSDAIGDLERWLVEHHPYDVPEVLSVAVAEGSDGYIRWLAGQVG